MKDFPKFEIADFMEILMYLTALGMLYDLELSLTGILVYGLFAFGKILFNLFFT